MRRGATLLGVAAALWTAGARAQEPSAGDARETSHVLTLGARFGPQSVYLEGAGSPSDLRGYVAGLEASLALSRHLAVAGTVEGSEYDARSDRLAPGPTATSLAAFAELRIDTHPEGPWTVRVDLGAGTRWLVLPLASGPTDTYGGVEALRMRLGPAYRWSDGLELGVALGAGFGWFTARPGARECAVTGACQDSLLETDTATPVHFVGDLTVVLRAAL